MRSKIEFIQRKHFIIAADISENIDVRINNIKNLDNPLWLNMLAFNDDNPKVRQAAIRNIIWLMSDNQEALQFYLINFIKNEKEFLPLFEAIQFSNDVELLKELRRKNSDKVNPSEALDILIGARLRDLIILNSESAELNEEISLLEDLNRLHLPSSMLEMASLSNSFNVISAVMAKISSLEMNSEEYKIVFPPDYAREILEDLPIQALDWKLRVSAMLETNSNNIHSVSDALMDNEEEVELKLHLIKQASVNQSLYEKIKGILDQVVNYDKSKKVRNAANKLLNENL